MSQNQHKRSQQGSRASLIILIVLAFLLMISAVILVIKFPDDEGHVVSENPRDPEPAAEMGFVCDPVEAQQLYPFAGGVFKIGSGRIAYLDFQGVENYSVEVDIGLPLVKMSEDLLLVADRDGYSYVVLDKNGEKFRGSLNGRILGGALSDTGDLALIQDQNNSTGIVSYISGSSGQKLYDCHFPESGHVLSVSFSPFSDHFDVVLLNTMSASAQIVLKRFSNEGQPVGQLLPQLPGLYPLVLYNSSRHLVLGGSSGLLAVNYENEGPVWEKDYFQVQTALADENRIMLLAAKNIDGPYSLFVIDDEGNEKEIFSLGEQVTGLQREAEQAAVFWSSRLTVINTDTGSELYTGDLGSEIIRADFTDAKSLLVITRAGVQRIVLP